jgi:signal transduction histidine kinase
MRQDFDQAQADRDQLFQDTREHVQNIAQGVKDQLAGFRQNMRDMHDGIAEMAGEVQTELQNLSTDLRTGGNIFRKESNPKMSHKASSLKNVRRVSKPKAGHKAKAKKGR